jgi:DNA-binding response OmpR family regulator
MHALIIEPQALTAFMIEDALRDIGYDSIAFASGQEEAVSAARACPPDLVTAAVQLSAGCGISAVEAICARAEPKIVFVTQSVREVRRRIRDATIVRKPFGVVDLVAAIAGAPAQEHGAAPARAAETAPA